MAVTYAWRLDADKYSYIVSPVDENGEYEEGFLSEFPLTGVELASIATTSESLFGENVQGGFDAYMRAFDAMRANIENEWGVMDLLSADVYYNVDAAHCADLRGVGIKGIKYLGGIKRSDSNQNMGGVPNGDIGTYDTSILQGAPGTYSVYGVFLEDQEEGSAPENIFLVSNAFDPYDSEGGDYNFVTQNEYEEGLDKLQQQMMTSDANLMNAIITNVSRLTSEINELKEGGVDGDFKSQLDDLEMRVVELERKLIDYGDLAKRIDELELALGAIETTEVLKFEKANGEGGTKGLHFVMYDEDSDDGILYISDSIKMHYNTMTNAHEVYSENGFFEDEIK
jgi:hypothetical protein